MSTDLAYFAQLKVKPARELICQGVKNVQVVHDLLAGYKLIEKVRLDPALGVVVVQLYSDKATQDVLSKRSFPLPQGGNVTFKERLISGEYALNGEVIYDLRSREGVENRCKQLQEYAKTAAYSQTDANIMHAIEQNIRGFGGDFTNLTIKCYGSRVQCLQLKGKSDFDIFVGKPGTFYGEPAANEFVKDADVEKLAVGLEKNMKSRPQIYGNVERPNVNVKCTYLPNNIDCDFSFMSGMAYYNSLLIRRMLDLDPRARPLVLLVKLWSEENGIRYFFSAYEATLMAIFYLQQEKILPPVSLWQQRAPSVLIEGWECGMVERVDWRTSNTKSVAELVRGFFNYYANFPFSTSIISVYSGTVIIRDVMDSGSGAPIPDMGKIDRSSYSANQPLYIMGPFKHNNTVQRLHKEPVVFKIIQQLLVKSSQILNNW